MSSSPLLLLCLALVVMLLSSSPTSAQSTTLYFTYYTPTTTYPSVCATGTMSCTANSNGTYTCPTVSGGNHYYYPTSNTPTFASPLLTTAQPALCERYTADFLVPLDTSGVTLAYGSSAYPVCVNLRLRNNSAGVFVPYADPDAVATYVNFTWGTSAASVAACPQSVAATASGSATVSFVYTILPTSAGTTTVCGAGSMSCASYGSGQYACTGLNSGATEYRYNASTNTTATTALTGITECNGFGDAYLPLDYEGISFAGSFFPNGNCVSWYGTNGASVGYDYNVVGTAYSYQPVSGTANFTTTTNTVNPASVCSAYVPYINPSPSQSSGPAQAAASLLSLLAVLVAVVALSL